MMYLVLIAAFSQVGVDPNESNPVYLSLLRPRVVPTLVCHNLKGSTLFNPTLGGPTQNLSYLLQTVLYLTVQ
jgi:hypothetical protein